MKEVVLVTGATPGIGREIVKILAPFYEVLIHYNQNYVEALKLKEQLETTYHRKFLIFKCDLSSEKEIDLMLERIYNEYPKIDILINNAGIAIDTLFEDKSKENFMKTLEINTIAPFLLSKKIGLEMRKNQYGIIINISSTNGIDTLYPESIDYDASKAGLISLTTNLANYLAPYVRVNTICPGWIKTDMNKNLSSEFIANERKKILLARFGEPKEVAEVVKFLISAKASYINNSIIRVDGGKKC